ncbi:unnamed protein product [Urochloa humidicola]
MAVVGEKMMVSALTGVMSPLIGKLIKLMEKECAKLKGARKKLESLTKELIAINVVLGKYALMESPDVQVKAWMKEVRELAYDIEDRIDLFTYHVYHEPAENATGVKRILRRYIQKLKKLHYRREFAKQIQELQVLVNEVYERQIRYKIDEGTSASTHIVVDPRLPALYVEFEKLVGIEGPSDELINRFIGKERPMERCRIAAIAGSGGSGKTTLANHVYKKIKDEFSYTAFVPVSQRPDMTNILRELLLQIEISGGRSDKDQLLRSSSERQLIDQLRGRLQNNRYLIVIDDIWSKSSWETIQCALPKNTHGSRIITTTRIKSLAEFCCTSDEDFVYQIKPLNRHDSEILFLKRAFSAEDHFPDQFKMIMNDILYKCDGLPLAIITIACLLASKPRRKEEWERVRDSIGSIHDKDKELEVIDRILSLSYHDLPCNLKTCLLYLSIFPEDCTIHKDYLVWKWIAEGFVVERKGYTLEEVGESYFNELMNRSLVQPLFMDYGVKASACRVHDIVLHFIINRTIEENFASILDSQDLSSPHGNKIRRLSFRDKQEQAGGVSIEVLNLSHARSIHLFAAASSMPSLLDLQVLRVLDLEGCEALKNEHLENIGSLFHLRYLGLRKTNVDKLPSQIGKLEFLQSLDVRGTRIKELPREIIQLKRLVHLVGYDLLLPDGFGKMEALQELSELDVCDSSKNFCQDIQNLRQLRELRVAFKHSRCGVQDRELRKVALLSSLCKLGEHNLRSLYIVNKDGNVNCFADHSWRPSPHRLQKFVMEGSSRCFSRFPKWIDPLLLLDLTHLEFRVKLLEKEDVVHVLQRLPALLVLHLSVKSIPRDGLTISRSGFHCITYLRFHQRFGPGVAFEEGAMPKLQKLDIRFHANKANSIYGGLGFGIRYLSSLNNIVAGIGYDRKDACAMRYAKNAINEEIKLLPNHPIKAKIFDH